MIEIPEIAPCWQISLHYDLNFESGDRIERKIQKTIHAFADL